MLQVFFNINLLELAADARIFTSQPSRVKRVCAGAGCNSTHLSELLDHHKKFATLVKKMGGSKGFLKGLSTSNPSAAGQQMAKLTRMMPPEMLQSMGSYIIYN